MPTLFLPSNKGRIVINTSVADDGFGNLIPFPFASYNRADLFGWYDGRSVAYHYEHALVFLDWGY